MSTDDIEVLMLLIYFTDKCLQICQPTRRKSKCILTETHYVSKTRTSDSLLFNLPKF